jgi:hypothetical protein
MKTNFTPIPTATHFVVLICTLFVLTFQSSVVAQTYTFTWPWGGVRGPCRTRRAASDLSNRIGVGLGGSV